MYSGKQPLSIINTRPPKLSSVNQFNRNFFRKDIPLLAVRVSAPKAGIFLKTPVLKGFLLHIPKVKTVVHNESNPQERLVLLGTADQEKLSPDARTFIVQEGLEIVQYLLTLDYDYWTTDEILEAVLPENTSEGTPTSFATAGHLGLCVAHVNLKDEYLSFKNIIGQVILDKNPNIKTVVNKLNNIHTQFRFFEMELLAGVPEYIVTVNESGCKFTFDFSKVYWNSRLHHEHERLVSLFNPGDVVVDVFAGVGPFALPAAKRGCVVLANDLNPESTKWAQINVINNHLTDRIRIFCEDGATFIRRITKEVWENPFPESGEVRSATQQRRELRKQPVKQQTPPRQGSKRISHFVMNLPDSAISFLPSFKNMFSELKNHPEFPEVYQNMPVVHCYCFTRELEFEAANIDIRNRVSTALNCSIEDSGVLHFVRRVAPNKDMYCISFALPQEVLL
ncbi:hypothetical protein Clacol_007482 [Clathrus columnatus]|uniref:tRNA (guanine(37)-N1)-methyltransferase n=1 Tax=Clathrus columnatus TaxID=1419009 RepID=A0AAV5AF16_9AGAM|nr:hypothetical protein Clacol_007482 [Clathrus columnatus]